MNDEDIVVGSIVVLVVLVVWEAARQWRWHAGAARRSTWPAELHDARLVYSERLFRTEGAVPISARVDRVYRLRSGQLVLLELKTRSSDRVYLSDVIELSAQRVALHGQTGEPVAEHAWVVVQRGAAGLESFRRVKLMSTDGVHRLLQHRNDVLAGRVAPMFTRAAGVCCRCQYLNKCERAATSASLHALRRRAGD